MDRSRHRRSRRRPIDAAPVLAATGALAAGAASAQSAGYADDKASWRHEFESRRGSPSSGTRTCKGTGPCAIAARVGEVDALKVRCRDPWGVTTTYWAAEYGEVRTFHVHNERGLEYDHELVAVERP